MCIPSTARNRNPVMLSMCPSGIQKVHTIAFRISESCEASIPVAFPPGIYSSSGFDKMRHRFFRRINPKINPCRQLPRQSPVCSAGKNRKRSGSHRRSCQTQGPCRHPSPPGAPHARPVAQSGASNLKKMPRIPTTSPIFLP